MAIDPVSYDGKTVQIDQSNAKEIYKAYRKGDVELNAAQKKYAESFLTRADYDEIEYDSDVANAEGREQIGDAKNADEAKAQGGNAAATSAPAAVLALLPLMLLFDGFSALAGAIITMVCAAASVPCAYLFDNEYSNRTQANDNAEGTNATLDDNTNVLESSMDAMNNDMETYEAQSEEYTQSVNTRTSDVASLQVQLKDAQAAGDTDGAKQIQAQLQQLQSAGFDDQEAGLEETRNQLNEYRSANSIAGGVSNAGQSVSKFLKEGTGLGVVAGVNGLLYTALGGLASLVGAGQMPKFAPFFPDLPASLASKIMCFAAAALFGWSAGIFIDKSKKEFECGKAGGEMQEHVDSLNDMIGQQEGYIDTTSGEYDATDSESAKNQEKAKQAAAKATGGGGDKSGVGGSTFGSFTMGGAGSSGGDSSGASSGGGTSV